ncbi:MAG: hypothetical protein KQI35_01760 [Bacteroidetes bacterium]|nr:hypothetical protein [Bacteroidota bacterium]
MKINPKYKPAVNKPWLYFLAGSMWTLVGMLLMLISLHWIREEKLHHAGILLIMGAFAGLIIHHFGFLKVVDKNLGRLSEMEGKRCVFSFMSWKSYLLVAIMMTMGITLRHSGIPHLYLAPVYSGIGLALFLSSIRYFRFLLKIIQKHES